MPYTYETTLPTDEDLAVTEINLSMAALYAASHHLGKVCEPVNNEFVLCKNETRDPRQCINEGKDVTLCTLDFFRKLKKNCREEFNQYATCIHKSSNNWSFEPCRNTQAVFDKCVLDKLGIERPEWGWGAEAHVHHTDQPKPEQELLYFPDAPDKYVEPEVKKPAKHGVRNKFA